jgi:predicted HTH transcriptional regulator
MEDVEKIIESREFGQLIGMVESAVFEAKSAGYDLAAAEGRYELAKDVSALANSEGGHVLIGVRTGRAGDKKADIVTGLEPIREIGFATEKYRGIIRELIYPTILGIAVQWLSFGEDDGGIGVIHVPRQPMERRPFIVAGVVLGGKAVKQIVFGYCERFGSANEPLSQKKLQQALKKGQDSLSQQLRRVEEKLDLLLDRTLPLDETTNYDRTRVDRRVADILKELE